MHMKKLLTLLMGIFIMAPVSILAQNDKMSLSGDVFDLYTINPLKGTVTDVLEAGDSTVISSRKSVSNFNGVEVDDIGFYASIPRTNKKYILRLRHDGYNPEYIDIDASRFGKRQKSVRLEPVYMERKAKMLDSVNVVASKVKFYHRGDALVYNADAFVLPEGSMLDALIEQLPGVTLNGDGVITVNGKRVDYLLLDGKEFFSRDKRLMLKNIASYTIKTIDVYNTLDRQYSSGRQGDEKLMMDVKLKKEYQKGYLLNAEAGYGTSGRYMGRLFGAMFTKNLRLGLIGNANNLNDERRPSEKGGWTPGDVSSGKKESSLGGLTYSYVADENRFNVSGDVTVGYSDSQDMTSSHITNFLPGGDEYGFRFNRSRLKNLNINTSHGFYMERKVWDLRLYAEYSYSHDRKATSLKEAFFNHDVQGLDDDAVGGLYGVGTGVKPEWIVNRTISDQNGTGHNSKGRFFVDSKYRFEKYNNDLRLHAEGNFQTSHNDRTESYMLNLGSDPAPARNFIRKFHEHPDHSYNAKASVEWYMPLFVGLSWTENYEYEYKAVTATNQIFLTEQTGSMSDYSNVSMRENSPVLDPNSFHSHQRDNVQRINTSLTYDFGSGKYLEVVVPVNIADRKLDYQRERVDTVISHTSIFPEVEVRFNDFDWTRQVYWEASYNMKSSLPGMTNFVDMTDTTDPLNIYKGNSGLRRTVRHKWNLQFRTMKSKRKFELYMWYETVVNALVRGFEYDKATGVRTYRPMNISGDNCWYASWYITQPFGKKDRFTINNNLKYTRQTNHDYVSEDGENMQRSRVRNLRFADKLDISYQNNGNKVTVFGNGAINRYTGSLESFRSFNAWDISYGVSGTVKLPYNFGLTTDFTVYMRRGYNDSALNTDNYVWNARLSYSEPRARLLFMVDAWDILHDIKNVSCHVNTQGRTETYSTVLPRYVLFHIQWNFSKQPKKK